jgi:hypothetical protein
VTLEFELRASHFLACALSGLRDSDSINPKIESKNLNFHVASQVIFFTFSFFSHFMFVLGLFRNRMKKRSVHGCMWEDRVWEREDDFKEVTYVLDGAGTS